MNRSVRWVGIAIAVSFLLVSQTPVSGETLRVQEGPRVVSGPGAQFYGYATPVIVVQRTGSLDYTNLDILQHDVVHDVAADRIASKKKRPWCSRFPRGKCPLFWSPRAGLGSTVAVKGLSGLKAGKIYTFFCTLHPGMKGNLVVAS